MTYLDSLIQILDPTGTLPIGIYGDENGDADYNTLIWGSEDVPKPTREEFDAAVQKARSLEYRAERRAAYPSIGEQLDLMFHDFDLWRARIQEIKDQYPKPFLSPGE